jgi:hypothetical protein
MNEDHYATARPAYDRTDWVCHNSDAPKPEILKNAPYMAGEHNYWNYCPICGAEL